MIPQLLGAALGPLHGRLWAGIWQSLARGEWRHPYGSPPPELPDNHRPAAAARRYNLRPRARVRL